MYRSTEMRISLPPDEVLITWLQAMVAHTTICRDLVVSLMSTMSDKESPCWWLDALYEAGETLLVHAQRLGAVRSDVGILDLLQLANAIEWITEKKSGNIDRLFQS
jgi:hypothetical protein